MSAKISLGLIIAVWARSFFWMQISELMKDIRRWMIPREGK